MIIVLFACTSWMSASADVAESATAQGEDVTKKVLQGERSSGTVYTSLTIRTRRASGRSSSANRPSSSIDTAIMNAAAASVAFAADDVLDSGVSSRRNRRGPREAAVSGRALK